MSPDEARAICERLGLLERIAADVAAAPPASPELVAKLRRIFTVPDAQPRRRTGAEHGLTDAFDQNRETG